MRKVESIWILPIDAPEDWTIRELDREARKAGATAADYHYVIPSPSISGFRYEKGRSEKWPSTLCDEDANATALTVGVIGNDPRVEQHLADLIESLLAAHGPLEVIDKRKGTSA